MVKIRFLRIGKKHQAFFRIVVVDSKRSPKSGKYLEEVGFYNPHTKEFQVKKERIEEWQKKGAKFSDSVYNLLIKKGIIKGKKIPVHSSKKKKEEEAEQKPPQKEVPSKESENLKESENNK